MKLKKPVPQLLTLLITFTAFHPPLYGETIEHGSTPEGPLQCVALPSGVAPIPKLASAWTTRDADGLTLHFSSLALSCGQSPTSGFGGDEECQESWTYSLTLPNKIAKPGVYHLQDYEVASSIHWVHPSGGGAGCSSAACTGMSGGSVGGGIAPTAPGVDAGPLDGGIGVHGPESTLELYSVSEDCVSGKIEGLTFGIQFPPPPEFNGGFAIRPCAQ